MQTQYASGLISLNQLDFVNVLQHYCNIHVLLPINLKFFADVHCALPRVFLDQTMMVIVSTQCAEKLCRKA